MTTKQSEQSRERASNLVCRNLHFISQNAPQSLTSDYSCCYTQVIFSNSHLHLFRNNKTYFHLLQQLRDSLNNITTEWNDVSELRQNEVSWVLQ